MVFKFMISFNESGTIQQEGDYATAAGEVKTKMWVPRVERINSSSLTGDLVTDGQLRDILWTITQLVAAAILANVVQARGRSKIGLLWSTDLVTLTDGLPPINIVNKEGNSFVVSSNQIKNKKKKTKKLLCTFLSVINTL